MNSKIIQEIHFGAEVDYRLSWDEAIDEFGPITPAYFLVRGCSSFFPSRDFVEKVDFTLANFGPGFLPWSKIERWREDKRLFPAGPRECFSVGKNDFSKQFREENYTIVSTQLYEVSTSRMCFIAKKGQNGQSYADFLETKHVGFSTEWFLFRDNPCVV